MLLHRPERYLGRHGTDASLLWETPMPTRTAGIVVGDRIASTCWIAISACVCVSVNRLSM